MRIILDKVRHVYQEGSPFSAVALDNVNMTVEEGEFLFLIGHTGSGKSTLAKHLNGLLVPCSGKVTVDGDKVEEIIRLFLTLPQDAQDRVMSYLRFEHSQL